MTRPITLALTGDYDDALRTERRLPAQTSHTEILGHIGRVYLATGAIDDSITNLHSALEANPEDVMVTFSLACAYQSRGEMNKAKPLFQMVINRYSELSRHRIVLPKGTTILAAPIFLWVIPTSG